MVSIGKTAVGVGMIMFVSMTNNAFWLLFRTLQEIGFPFYRMFGISCLLTGVVVSSFVLRAHGMGSLSPPHKSQWKWLVCRGTFAVATNCFSLTAVALGISFGDLGALTSINTVVATLLGRLFLGEPLKRIQVFGLISAISGAVFIAQPSLIFGKKDGPASEWSYLCALLAGFCQGCLYVVSRKASQTPVHQLTLSACFQVGAAFMILPFTPLLEDGTIARASSQLWLVALVIIALTVLTTTSSLAFSHGAKVVPAAMSATADTAMSMASGYLVEAIVFQKALELYPLLGAVLMLLSVVTMAVSKVPAPILCRQDAQSSEGVAKVAMGEIDEPTAPASPALTLDDIDIGELTRADDEGANADAEQEGLACFIASEFVDTEPQARFPLRKRLPSKGSGIMPVALQLGSISVASGALA